MEPVGGSFATGFIWSLELSSLFMSGPFLKQFGLADLHHACSPTGRCMAWLQAQLKVLAISQGCFLHLEMDLDDSCIEFSQVMNKTERQRVQFRRKKICRLICFMDRKPSPSPQTVPWRESYQCHVIVSMLMFLTIFISLPRFSSSPRPHQLCSLPVPNTVCSFCHIKVFSVSCYFPDQI